MKVKVKNAKAVRLKINAKTQRETQLLWALFNANVYQLADFINTHKAKSWPEFTIDEVCKFKNVERTSDISPIWNKIDEMLS